MTIWRRPSTYARLLACVGIGALVGNPATRMPTAALLGWSVIVGLIAFAGGAFAVALFGGFDKRGEP